MKSNLNERKFFLHKIFKTDSDLIQNTKKPSVKLDHKVAKIKKSKENKSRKYDYDSIKKSLDKNLWYYVLEQNNLMLQNNSLNKITYQSHLMFGRMECVFTYIFLILFHFHQV